MAVTAMSFRWLDLLEKEFDKAYVDLDILIGDLDSDEPEMVYTARQKMSTLSSCFAQLTHKAQTIFQNNAKLEAELVDMRSDLVDLQTRNEELSEELHSVLVQVHKTQLQAMSKQEGKEITSSLNAALLQRSPTHRATNTGVNVDKLVRYLQNWKKRLEYENESLRTTIATLQAEVCGARLSARYLDKELAGRIQQLQLVGRTDMVGAMRDKLWAQLEAEILVQRQKTVVRAVRQRDSRAPGSDLFNIPRIVTLNRDNSAGLGISITGGREHGVPILISELEPGGGTDQLYVGDAILSVNGIDLTQASHNEAVKVLSGQVGDVKLKVKYMGQDDIEEDSDLSQLRYGFFNDGNHVINYDNKYNDELTPTAPRTPDSSAREPSEESYTSSPRISEDHRDATNGKAMTTTTTTESNGTSPQDEEEDDEEEEEEEESKDSSSMTSGGGPASPLHIGVTTLQKLFRSLTPSGVWKEDHHVVPPPQQLNHDNHHHHHHHHHHHEVVGKPTSIALESPTITLVNKTPGGHHHNRPERSSHHQLFHPESQVLANSTGGGNSSSYVDGFGDASFGTPV